MGPAYIACYFPKGTGEKLKENKSWNQQEMPRPGAARQTGSGLCPERPVKELGAVGTGPSSFLRPQGLPLPWCLGY